MEFPDLPQSRDDALAHGAKLFFNGRPCRRGHVAPRQTADSWCTVCRDAKADATRKRNADRKRELYQNDPDARERMLETSRRHYRDNPEARAKILAGNSAYIKAKRDEDPDGFREKVTVASRKRMEDPEYREKQKAYRRKWLKDNSDLNAEAASRRRAAERGATPSWLTKDMREEMLAVFTEAKAVTSETGVPHEVDHIIPLRGRTICGLHVPWNLQIETMSGNRSKHNRLPPEHQWLAPTPLTAHLLAR